LADASRSNAAQTAAEANTRCAFAKAIDPLARSAKATKACAAIAHAALAKATSVAETASSCSAKAAITGSGLTAEDAPNHASGTAFYAAEARWTGSR
jgi:hypothetical protein